MFDFVIASIRRRKFIFIISCLLGIAAGYFYSGMKARYYETEMIVQQNSLTRRVYYEIINNLDNLLKTRSYNDLSEELKMGIPSLKKIISIEALSITDETLSEDTSSRLGLPFKIHVKVKDNDVLSELQTSLINYLNQNPYVKRKREGQTAIFEQKLEFIDMELAKLDSLKGTYNRTLSAMRNPTTFYNNALNPAELYEHSLNLANQKESIKNWLNTETVGILIIDDFKNPENPRAVSRIFYMIAGLLAGLLLGVFLVVMSALKARL